MAGWLIYLEKIIFSYKSKHRISPACHKIFWRLVVLYFFHRPDLLCNLSCSLSPWRNVLCHDSLSVCLVVACFPNANYPIYMDLLCSLSHIKLRVYFVAQIVEHFVKSITIDFPHWILKKYTGNNKVVVRQWENNAYRTMVKMQYTNLRVNGKIPLVRIGNFPFLHT